MSDTTREAVARAQAFVDYYDRKIDSVETPAGGAVTLIRDLLSLLASTPREPVGGQSLQGAARRPRPPRTQDHGRLNMGYMRHHAIVVTSWNETVLREAHGYATSLGGAVTPIIEGSINEQYSFALLPDGSKEGWDHSHAGDAQRDALVSWMDTKRYGDGSSPLAWVEVQFGDDDRVTKVTRHSDEPEREITGGAE